MIRFNDIVKEIEAYMPDADMGLLQKAYVYSAKAHQGQTRLSGEPYLSHPLEVAYILAKKMKMDMVSIISGLLHDIPEDTGTDIEEIRRLFGDEVATIVNGVTNITKIKFSNHEERRAENMRKVILAMTEDIRVIMVKFADRLHNMMTLGYHTPEKQELIARETLDIYAPLAGRMGIYWLKSSFEDLCLYYLEPVIYEKIKNEIAERADDRERFIREVKEIISDKLKEAGINAVISGRHKHFYSIYRKMKEQNLNVNQVYDLIAFRIIVNSIKECYESLGLIHSMWKPLPGRIKDYISMPKPNGYRSLHTTVIGPYGQRMEVQIRTWEMHRIAEEGIAAHWKYKEHVNLKETDERQFMWFRHMLENLRGLKDPREFIENVRMELFPNEVYVFTPKGDVKALPKGSTPIDFAYSIHSEVGNRCSGSKVNGRLVPLKYELKNGDIVEIITSPKQHPRKDWLEFVKTSKAKNRIRQWIRRQEKEQSIALGRELLERALRKANIEIPNIIKSDQILSAAKEFSFNSIEDLLMNIGYCKVSPGQVVGRLKPLMEAGNRRTAGIVGKVVSRIKRRKHSHVIQVKGMDDLLIRFANCCNPLPGESVVGFITRGRGVSIHKSDCKFIKDVEPGRLVDVKWQPSEDDMFVVKLKITSIDKKGILADISAIIAKKDANIIEAEVKTTVDKKGVSYFTLEVEDYKQLRDIMGEIKKVKDVLLVERV